MKEFQAVAMEIRALFHNNIGHTGTLDYHFDHILKWQSWRDSIHGYEVHCMSSLSMG